MQSKFSRTEIGHKREKISDTFTCCVYTAAPINQTDTEKQSTFLLGLGA